MDTTFWVLFFTIVLFNAVLLVAGIYVMYRVCKTAKLAFPITITSLLLVYSTCSLLAISSLPWLAGFFTSN